MHAMHEYSEEFFQYIERGSIASAKRFTSYLVPLLKPKSLLDVGCGRGAWLEQWRQAGVSKVEGVDGPYVNLSSLLISKDEFNSKDLSKEFNLGRRFDLVTSLEVAEHLPPLSSPHFIASLVNHGDLILFSAATPGQGGENHINERPLAFWQSLFASHGYEAFDAVRPVFRTDKTVEPWYRYNTLLYVSPRAIAHLPSVIRERSIAGNELRDEGDLNWRLRRWIIRHLPRATVTRLAKWNANRVNERFKASEAAPKSVTR
jgi:cyclopropane fatty-acyl-phospholipid synthase-like methyltransferase